MAKLGSYYGLCPLIDQHNLLGVSEDVDPGHAIVTLGKNIAVKYKLSDQKQVQSWRTKDKFSSPVLFDKEENKYIAAFNQTYLRMWDGTEESLDKLKKYKFNKPLHTIVKCGGNLFVIFQNGGILPLKTALNDRKDVILDEVVDVNSEEIADIIHTSIDAKNLVYIGILVKSQNNMFLVWSVFINGTAYHQSDKISLNRSHVTLTGYVLSQMYDGHINLLTLWSDGKLFSRSIMESQSEENSSIDNITPYGTLFASIESVSCTHLVKITTVNSDYIALYGAECNQEGACLVLYNLQFKISQSKQSFKMFSNFAKIWCIENYLLLCVGQNLAVVPFYLNTEQLAALVGSHTVVCNEKDADIAIVQDLKIGKWDIEETNAYTEKLPSTIKSSILELLHQGFSEALICEHLIPIYIENKDIDSIIHCLAYFQDIPELCIVKLIQFIITIDNKLFGNQVDAKSEVLYPKERCNLVDTILAIPCSDVLLLPHVRRELDVNCTLLLLQYICHLLSIDGHCLPSLNVVTTESKLINWSCVLLDANYQKFLLTRDENVCHILNNFRNLIQDHLKNLEDLKNICPLLMQLNKGISLNRNRNKGSQKYCIEQLNMY